MKTYRNLVTILLCIIFSICNSLNSYAAFPINSTKEHVYTKETANNSFKQIFNKYDIVNKYNKIKEIRGNGVNEVRFLIQSLISLGFDLLSFLLFAISFGTGDPFIYILSWVCAAIGLLSYPYKQKTEAYGALSFFHFIIDILTLILFLFEGYSYGKMI